jgi:gluconate 5-dehydrogenase
MEKKMTNYFNLKGQVAVVTGASTGLGVQMAKAFASQGANIVLLARRQNLLDQNAAEIEKQFGVKVLPYACDITNPEAVKGAVEATIKTFNRVDILVNNAGTGAVAPTVDITDEQFNNELKIDLYGTFLCSREFAKYMIKAKYGRIINIASMYGLVGNMAATCAPYHAAKGGVVNLTRALAAEWGKEGITVNAICPGYFWTPLTKETLESEWFANYAKGAIPLGRYGKEGELDTCALFLASPYSSYVNGQNIAVDGGYTAI